MEILGEIRGVQVIAAGRGVKSRHALNRMFGSGRWRKMKGIAVIQWQANALCEAEIHWYEAHGVGRVLFKRKRILRWL